MLLTVITMDNVEVLLFDVFGTVVDWYGTIKAELARTGENFGPSGMSLSADVITCLFLSTLMLVQVQRTGTPSSGIGGGNTMRRRRLY